METIKKEVLERYNEHLARGQHLIESVGEILKALDSYTGQVVNARFFKKHFSESNEWSQWTSYAIIKARYSYRGDFELHIPYTAGDSEYINLESRETSHFKEILIKRLATYKEMNENTKKALSEVENTDEQAIKKEIIAIYTKHNKPSIWGEILKDYNVMYPNK